MTKMTKVIIMTSAIFLLSACSSSNEKEQAFITSKEQAFHDVSLRQDAEDFPSNLGVTEDQTPT
ncbi:hypothetical protein P4S75_07135 [Anoxybacillus ayderensis]|uniref:hypothetical protein n=1 Tax=Anoxybacillus ayderensis TaxID=265546 RepID=UPI002E241493|nr:hypothetical protein [Anoxybacillus ayderensis]